jgi:hypothetical protein
MHLGQVGELDEGERILPIQYLKYLKAYLTRRKILTTWDLRLYFPSVLRFIGLKNQSRWPGVNPATLGSSGKHTNNCATEATRPG